MERSLRKTFFWFLALSPQLSPNLYSPVTKNMLQNKECFFLFKEWTESGMATAFLLDGKFRGYIVVISLMVIVRK